MFSVYVDVKIGLLYNSIFVPLCNVSADLALFDKLHKKMAGLLVWIFRT